MVTDSTAVRDAPRIWRLLRARPRQEGADAVIDLTEEVGLAEDAGDEAPAKRRKAIRGNHSERRSGSNTACPAHEFFKRGV